MTIFFLSPGCPETLSGGTRKLYDNVAVLRQNDFDAEIVHQSPKGIDTTPDDLWVLPEVFGDALYVWPEPGIPRMSYAQNGYLVGRYGVKDDEHHPYEYCADLVGVLCESQHTIDILRKRYPKITAPLIRTHSSGNGRIGKPGPFSYGPWPRKRQIAYFEYKHEALNRAIFGSLPLPDGWELVCMAGMSDDDIALTYRESAIFAAANFEEGLCAPTQEAMISGAYFVGWSGQGPDEYLKGRGWIVKQDDVEALRKAIVKTAQGIDRNWQKYAADTGKWSKWHTEVGYSREREIQEICDIFDQYHGRS